MGHVADLHCPVRDAILTCSGKGGQNGAHLRTLPYSQSDQVIKDGKTKAGKQRDKCQYADCPGYSFPLELTHKTLGFSDVLVIHARETTPAPWPKFNGSDHRKNLRHHASG